MKKAGFVLASILSVLIGVSSANAKGNTENQSFYQAKKMLEQHVYTQIPQKTIYCDYDFNLRNNKRIRLDNDFYTKKHGERADRVEWEHIVPAENFGRIFPAWRNGHEICIDDNGKQYKGRKCAEKVHEEFRLMQADMYNLYPSVGAVNATRSNFNFTVFSKGTPNSFGSCPMKVYDRKAEPPEHARGKIARAYLYMEDTYRDYGYHMSDSNRKLMEAWNKMYPVTVDECTRTRLIEGLQHNENRIVKELCIQNNMW